MSVSQILPPRGRVTTRRVVEGHRARSEPKVVSNARGCTSTMLRVVPLPVPGRI